MYLPEQLQSPQQREALLSVATTHFSALEDCHPEIERAERRFEDTIANARESPERKDAHEFFSLKRFRPALYDSHHVLQDVYEVSAQPTLTLEACREHVEWNATSYAARPAAKNARRARSCGHAVKQMRAAIPAYDNLTKAAQQATDIAQAT